MRFAFRRLARRQWRAEGSIRRSIHVANELSSAGDPLGPSLKPSLARNGRHCSNAPRVLRVVANGGPVAIDDLRQRRANLRRLMMPVRFKQPSRGDRTERVPQRLMGDDAESSLTFRDIQRSLLACRVSAIHSTILPKRSNPRLTGPRTSCRCVAQRAPTGPLVNSQGQLAPGNRIVYRVSPHGATVNFSVPNVPFVPLQIVPPQEFDKLFLE